MGCGKVEKADDNALYKEELPRKISVGDVWMNLHKLPDEQGKKLESAAEGDSLMGRLASRMASRDMIDELDLGPVGRSPEAKKAQVADGGLGTGIKTEMEHAKTISKIIGAKPGTMDKEKGAELIAKDHLKEHKDYYDKKEGLPAMEKKLESQDLMNAIPSKMFLGAGLHAQTKDLKAFNSSDPIPTEKVRPGKNMAAQAKNAGNVFNTMLKKDKI